MDLIQLIYVSSMVGSDESMLASIHSHAVRNNTTHAVTGMLLYLDGHFLQVLEGERKIVHHTFDKIKKDPRHKDVALLMVRPIAEKEFSHWNMGFRHMRKDDWIRFPQGPQLFDNDLEQIKANPLLALEMLKALV
jgi:hypothetical protein